MLDCKEIKDNDHIFKKRVELLSGDNSCLVQWVLLWKMLCWGLKQFPAQVKQWNNRHGTEWICTKSSSACMEGERVKSSTHTTWSANELTIQTTANVKVTPILNIVSISVSSTSNFHTGSSQNAPKMLIFNFIWKISQWSVWLLEAENVSIITGVTAWDNARRIPLVFLI